MLSALALIGSVSVNVTTIQTRVEIPSTQLTYEVCNKSDKPIWLVDDNWLMWRLKGKQIELSYAREKLQRNAEVFGYFSPTVVKIKSGDTITRTVELVWPQTLDRLWNDSNWAAPTSGKYEVSVKVGYGVTAEPKPVVPGESVETPVLHWQTIITSSPQAMDVPVYKYPDKKNE